MKGAKVRTLLAGVAGGLAMNLAMLLTFRTLGFGWDGKGFLLDASTHSPKLIAVWTQIEPLPLIAFEPVPMIVGLMLFGIGHAYVYRWLSPTWPSGVVPRALRLAGLLFFLVYMFWEFFTPFNLFREPLPLIAAELVFWAVIALAEAFSIAFVLDHRPRSNI